MHSSPLPPVRPARSLLLGWSSTRLEASVIASSRTYSRYCERACSSARPSCVHPKESPWKDFLREECSPCTYSHGRRRPHFLFHETSKEVHTVLLEQSPFGFFRKHVLQLHLSAGRTDTVARVVIVNETASSTPPTYCRHFETSSSGTVCPAV